MNGRAGRVAVRLAVALGAVAGLTALFRGPLSANPTTVALSYVVLVLFVAEWGLAEATIVALVASLAFNVFFLPPFGTVVIADPENWFSFVALMLTAIVVGQLSGRARVRRLEALSRQRDLERLYALGRGLLLTGDGGPASDGIARHVADAFGLRGVVLYDHHTGGFGRAGTFDLDGIEDRLREVARQSVPQAEPGGLVLTPIRLGGAPVGALAIAGEALSDTVLQSVTNLVAIGLERAHERTAAATLDAARRSGELRAALLDAVAHEFKTPLTSIRAAVNALADGHPSASSQAELVAIIDEESARLHRLVSDAIQMFRIEAGDVRPEMAPHPLKSVVEKAIRAIGPRAGAHALANEVGAAQSVVADAGLLELALRQMLDNALKYSPPAAPIAVSATQADGRLEIAVRNAGPAIPEHEQARVFERFYRGDGARTVPGTGMGLAIVRRIAEAHGGGVSTGRDGGETVFRLSLPLPEGQA